MSQLLPLPGYGSDMTGNLRTINSSVDQIRGPKEHNRLIIRWIKQVCNGRVATTRYDSETYRGCFGLSCICRFGLRARLTSSGVVNEAGSKTHLPGEPFRSLERRAAPLWEDVRVVVRWRSRDAKGTEIIVTSVMRSADHLTTPRSNFPSLGARHHSPSLAARTKQTPTATITGQGSTRVILGNPGNVHLDRLLRALSMN